MIEYKKENLGELKTIGQGAPEGMKAFQEFSKVAFAEGELDAKTKELIAVAAAIAAKCSYCLDIHGANARRAGATEAELSEVAMVAAAIGAGAAMTHATHALK